MTAHTRGPWEAKLSEGRGTLCVQSADGVWICGEFQADNETSIPSDEAWGNARVCAAGLDLLKAAREVMDLLAKYGPSIVPHLMDTDMNAGQRLRDAIAKATATGAAS